MADLISKLSYCFVLHDKSAIVSFDGYRSQGNINLLHNLVARISRRTNQYASVHHTLPRRGGRCPTVGGSLKIRISVTATFPSVLLRTVMPSSTRKLVFGSAFRSNVPICPPTLRIDYLTLHGSPYLRSQVYGFCGL